MSFLMRKNAYFKLAKIRKKNDLGKRKKRVLQLYTI